ncbi:malectin domain-containing carbohydrate-binding protein [Catalinimonas alkaloidigena]|uniref:malectin domain-containing carbohydrate-binding protein n=1 Tax=Catalinimonas alkaloidigena TaxID=1075417 RepID=UPI001FE23F35|nr:malectin domain-containing carbohydrate-binding protein [Catalinimonas alkaloidigena]
MRQDISLNEGWQTVANDTNQEAYAGFEEISYITRDWEQIEVPHNWDGYEGYRRKLHGNRHGYAWYRKRFTVAPQKEGQRYFLFFEGVGSYATVWLNGQRVGYHAGGRTTFTLDVTDAISLEGENVLAVRADHPAFIEDLPWVCGGCSDERGFSEGSQPMGIFRPVHLIVTDPVRIEPFGVHVWNDTTVSAQAAQLHLTTELKNYGSKAKAVQLKSRLLDRDGKLVFEVTTKHKLRPGGIDTIAHQPPVIANPHLWSVDDPYLYTLVSEVVAKGNVIDRTETPYGIRWISWPIYPVDGSQQFYLNGKPVFIHGIAEYEHLLGQSHAFTAEEVRARALQMKNLGFNSFRDAHQPHNLDYQTYWDSLGVLWWTQLSAHIWYDTPEFRENFKTLLKDWVKERRNSPSVVLWGLQNESHLPADFARECTELIRQLDPTTSSQRLVTTCNGGEGTDWDVPQNWTGTYGGDPTTYNEDVKRQVLIGEYGAWRTLDLHTEGPFDQNGIYSEDRMTQLMEMKVRLAESVRDSASGHYFWLFSSHDNPGRVQAGEGYRELDRIGPVNYKGLMTPWEEPLDVYHMFRSNYATEPMVYLVSHTWPDRWTEPGMKDSLVVYSNCDEVELFNDVGGASLGKKKRNGIGTHFQWDGLEVQYNVLEAVGYVDGKEVARDRIVLRHLPPAPHFEQLYQDATPLTDAELGWRYLYRVNCGGPTYVDTYENQWQADRAWTDNDAWGSLSWTNQFPGMPAYFASQRRTYDPIRGTRDWELFQTFRYGRDQLRYRFPVPDGEYRVELYFTEPWLGTGGGQDCTGWRLFDVAVNGTTVLKDLDLWKEAGHDGALKKVVTAQVTGGQLEVSFPNVAAGQAVISGIAIATENPDIEPAPAAPNWIGKLTTPGWSAQTWLDAGQAPYAGSDVTFLNVPPDLYGSEWLQKTSTADAEATVQFAVTTESEVHVALDTILQRPDWMSSYEDLNTCIDLSDGRRFHVYRKRFPKGSTVTLGAPDGATDFLVIVQQTSTIDPPYDLKESTQYKAFEAELIGEGISKKIFSDNERAIYNRASGDTLAWHINVGVADIYSLEVKYHNPHEATGTGRLEVRSADGSLMKAEDVEFTETRPGKWNYINTTTGSMINAGDYTVLLISTTAAGVLVDALSVK